MLQELVTGLFDHIATQARKHELNNFYEKEMKANRDFYKRQMNDATSLFNHIYYRDYVNTPTAQHMLKQARKQLDQQSKALQNTAVVMGYTPEAMAAQQKSNNQILDNVVSSLSAADAQHKEQALYNYENMRSKMQELLHNATMGLATNKLNMEQNLFDKNYEMTRLNMTNLFEKAKNNKDKEFYD